MVCRDTFCLYRQHAAPEIWILHLAILHLSVILQLNHVKLDKRIFTDPLRKQQYNENNNKEEPECIFFDGQVCNGCHGKHKDKPVCMSLCELTSHTCRYQRY